MKTIKTKRYQIFVEEFTVPKKILFSDKCFQNEFI